VRSRRSARQLRRGGVAVNRQWIWLLYMRAYRPAASGRWRGCWRVLEDAGLIVPHTLPYSTWDVEPVNYDWCHGPAGTSQLFAAQARAATDAARVGIAVAGHGAPGLPGRAPASQGSGQHRRPAW
jgi:hypothetical protein